MTAEHDLLITTCLLAGRIMMESGSEAYRVEDTMQRIAWNTDETLETEAYVTATGIFMTISNLSKTQMVQARNRTINLEKVDRTNNLSRLYQQKEMTLLQLYEQLLIVDRDTPDFNRYMRMIATGVASFSLMLIMGGQYHDIPVAFIIGAIGQYISSYAYVRTGMKFINDLFAVTAISVLAVLSSRLGWVQNLDSTIIGCIMPLVPGLAITASVRDLFEGHLLTGMVRLVEALMVATMIGLGIALALQWLL